MFRFCLPVRTPGLLTVAIVALLLAATDFVQGQTNRAPIRDSKRTFEKKIKSWQEIKYAHLIRQRRDYSCGAAALATLLKYFWNDPATETSVLRQLDHLLTPEEVRDRIKNGLSLTDLRRVAVRMGYQASIGKLSFSQLTEARVPLVVGITVDGYDHFVVYRGTDGRYVYLADPIRGNIRTLVSQFIRQWQENAVLAVAKPGADIPTTSALQVRSEETTIGRLNRQMIRRRLSDPPNAFPTPVPLRP